VVDADPSVTLEEDLQRRDFTLNAIARDEETGELVDPYGGVRDIQDRVLRHVGPPSSRIRCGCCVRRVHGPLRAAGFPRCRRNHGLMRQMVDSGELDALVPERVWQELRRALASAQPSAFLRTLHECGALGVILPEVDALYGVPQRAEFHPEVDTGRHQEMVSDMAARLAPGDDLAGFAALTHDLGKALTPKDQLPRHIMHEQRGVAPLRKLAARLKVPAEHQQLAEAVCREHLNVHRIDELRDATVLELLSRCDGFRRPERIARIALVCECDKRGRLGFEDSDYPQGETLQRLHRAALSVQARDLDTSQLKGRPSAKR
jgi:tRNA nucleotidyltransferase/poly(A) polymerase